MAFDPTATNLAMVAGVILSLLFSYVPGLNEVWAMQDATRKRIWMAGLTFLTALGVFGLGCAGIVSGVACNKDGVIMLVVIWIQALVANQAVYAVSPETAVVREIKQSKAGSADLGLGKG